MVTYSFLTRARVMKRMGVGALLIAAGWCSALFAVSDAAAQGWRQEPALGPTTLVSGFVPDPAEYHVTAGGGSDPVDVAGLGLVDAATGAVCTRAFVGRAPNFRLSFKAGTEFHFLRFYAQAHDGADLTLLISQPDASWRCNDDAYGLMPAVDVWSPTEGQYDVWVGTYDGSTGRPAVLYITELEQNFPGGGYEEPWEQSEAEENGEHPGAELSAEEIARMVAGLRALGAASRIQALLAEDGTALPGVFSNEVVEFQQYASGNEVHDPPLPLALGAPLPPPVVEVLGVAARATEWGARPHGEGVTICANAASPIEGLVHYETLCFEFMALSEGPSLTQFWYESELESAD
jgi:hypothetical protein